MRIVRLGPPGAERPAILTPDGRLVDLRPVTADVDAQFLARGIPDAQRALQAGELPPIEEQGQRFGAPVARPGKVVGIGLNYASHALETGAEPPTEPVVFLKAPTSVSGPTDPIRLLPGGRSTDYEVELGVVLGAPLRGESSPQRALTAVAGYVVANDVSDRDLQLHRGGTWTKGKSADTFCPVGPWLVTPDEVGDTRGLRLRLAVNGEPRQDGHTSDTIFGIGELLCYVSSLMSLEPGDLMITGTPSGVAMGRPEPKPYLRDGDVVELEIDGLGKQRTVVQASEPDPGAGLAPELSGGPPSRA